MPSKRSGPENGERVRRTDTGEPATYVQKHEQKGQGCHDVLLDHGPKRITPWLLDTPLEVLPMPKVCPRCGMAGHHPFVCSVVDP